jgi:cobalt-zinc-cadmium efflux system outer membrane protein
MERADALRTLEFTVKQQFVQAALAESAVGFAKEAAAVASQTFDLVNVRYRAGAVSEADLAKVETAKLEADQAVDSAQQDWATAKVDLAFILGERSPSPDYIIQPGPLHDALARPLPETNVEALTALAFTHRPDLRGAAFDQQRAAASLSLSKRQQFPDIALSLNYVQEGTGQNAIQPPTLSFGVSTPLPLFYQYRGEIEKATADYHGRTIQRSKTEAQVAADVSSALVVYASSRTRLDRMQGRLLDRAKRARDLVQVQYEKGAASLLELIDAERTFIATEGEYLQDLTDYWTAVFALERAVGTDLLK